MHYRATNNRLNFDKLSIIFLMLVPTIVWVFLSKPDLTWFIVLGVIESVLIVGLLKWYKESAFELKFLEDKIIYQKKFLPMKTEFAYSDLRQVHVNESISPRYQSSNIFAFQNGNSTVKLRTDMLGHGESFVNFVKFLKTKNSDFETYVKPKGTKLHLRLRQEILKTEL